MEKLDFLVRFWELRARFEVLGVPLTKSEGFELLSLLQFLAADNEPEAIESIDASSRGIPAQLTAGSGFLSAGLKDLSAERVANGGVGGAPHRPPSVLLVARGGCRLSVRRPFLRPRPRVARAG